MPMTELGARSLSVLFSLLGVLSLVVAGGLSGSLRRGFVAALLLAGSCLSIRYAQEARMYALLESFVCIQLAAYFYVVQNRGSRRAELIFVAAAAGTAFAHLFGLLSTLMLLPMAGGKSVRRKLRNLSCPLIILVAGLIATFGFFIFHFDSRFIEWQKISYLFGASVGESLLDFVFSFGQFDGVVLFLVIATALASWSHPDKRQRRLARTLITGATVLIASAALVEWTQSRHVLITRYFLFLNPYVFWCVALGLEVIEKKIKSSRQRTAFIPIVLMLFLISSAKAYDYSNPSWRDIAHIAASEKVSLVLTTRPRGFAVPYYSEHGINVERFSYDREFLDLLKSRLKTNSKIMVIDDAYHRMQYQLDLLSMLNQAGFPTSTYDIANEKGGAVFAVLIWNKN